MANAKLSASKPAEGRSIGADGKIVTKKFVTLTGSALGSGDLVRIVSEDGDVAEYEIPGDVRELIVPSDGGVTAVVVSGDGAKVASAKVGR